MIIVCSGQATRWKTEELWLDSRQRQGIFFPTVGPNLGLTYPSIEWVPGTVSAEVKSSGVNLVSHLYQVSNLKMCGAIPPRFLLHVHSNNFFFNAVYLLTLRYLENVTSKMVSLQCFVWLLISSL
jgi:hypothetical protein